VVSIFVFPPSCLSHPNGIRSVNPGNRRAIRKLSVTLVLLLVGTPVLLWGALEQGRVDEVGPGFELVQDGWGATKREAVRLVPEEWLGRRLPLISYIHGQTHLDEAQWLLIFWRKECDLCQQQAPEYLALARELWRQKQVATVMLNMSSSTPVGEDTFPSGPSTMQNWLVLAHLESNRDWIVETPVVLWLKGGVVVSVGRTVAAAASWFGLRP
jgi:hypothetical protein